MTARLRVVGVDWAVKPKKRGLVGLAFEPNTRRIAVEYVLAQVPDEEVVLAVRSGRYSTVAVDVPFGWPTPFSNFTPEWSCVECRSDLLVPESRAFELRHTDLLVQKHTGLKPLSVSSDRIALTALSWVRLVAAEGLQEFIDVHAERPTAPRPSLIEVYPAATMAVVFGRHEFKGYKDDPAARRGMLDRFRAKFRMEWKPEHQEALVGKGKHSHAADALVAAVTALMYEGVLDHTLRRPLSQDEVVNARREGWIFTPALDPATSSQVAPTPRTRKSAPARKKEKG